MGNKNAAPLVEFLTLPDRVRGELWPWIVAVHAFDHGDASLLEKLTRTRPAPDEMRPVLADIIAGARRPDQRSTSREKIPARERLPYAASVSCVIELIDVMRFRAINDPSDGLKPGITSIAARKGVEPLQVSDWLIEERRQVIAEAARDCSVSEATIRNLLREFRAAVKEWLV